ncbi:hypothetical protein EIM92_23015 [Paenibacillus lentus]|uniref:DUF4177 domain-containing protein n=2 Tax=Paenibacillus lentus TaxID=1338368 RepID=A0A3S8S0L9_9BACL|nr:hypothetical protein EIM92_23015 [Paenibacillus lentus]
MKEIVDEIRYRQHATLIRIVTYNVDVKFEKCWEFECSDLTRTYGEDATLVEVLNELSSEGWELVCPLVGEEGYILRAIEYEDGTITYYEMDEEEVEV